MKEKSLLIPIDGSSHSQSVVRYVSSLGLTGDVHIKLYHVLCPVPESFWDHKSNSSSEDDADIIPYWESLQKQSIEESMDELVDIFSASGVKPDNITVDVHPRDQGVARDIRSESMRSYHAVILGRKGNANVNIHALGSVSNKIAYDFHNHTVWLIGERAGSNRILVAMDKSEGAQCALEYVANMLHGTSTKILLFHAVRRVEIEGPSKAIMNEPDHRKKMEKRITQRIEAAANQMDGVLDAYVERLLKKGFPKKAVGKEVRVGVPSRAEAILDTARDGGFNTIVLGRRGLSNTRNYAMGRVCEKVMRSAEDHAVWIVHRPMLGRV